MYKTKDFLKGLVLGLVAPVIAMYFYVTLVLKVEFVNGIKQLISEHLFTEVVTLSVLANLLVAFVFFNRKEYQKLRGVVGAVLLYALFVVGWNVFG